MDDPHNTGAIIPMSAWLFLLLAVVGSSTHAFATDSLEIGCARLELVLDSRFEPSVVEREWASGAPRDEAPAILRLRGCAGELLDHLTLDAPLARLDPSPLRGAPAPTYLVSEDLTAPAGSYSGPLTLPIQVVNGRLKRVLAKSDGHFEPIRLALTGKAAWKKVAVGAVDDILSVSCEPKDHGFVIRYTRYHPTRRYWKVRMRSELGFWESDGEFPELRRFP